MYLLCNKVFSNEAMKPSRLSEHLTKIHPDKLAKVQHFFSAFGIISKNEKLLVRCLQAFPSEVLMDC